MGQMWLVLILCFIVVTAVGLMIFGSNRWADAIKILTRQLDACRIRQKAQVCYNSCELDGLPSPVQRYFRAVLKDGQPLIAAVTIELAGTFNMSTTGEQWKPFTSTQRVVTHRPGFLWDAKVAIFPGVPVRVVDSYVGGEGQLRAALLGLFPMADVHGGGEIARGEFIRWFAEAVWYPTALLPSQGVHWEAVDDVSAKATIVDGLLKLTMLFGFDDAGLIVSVRATARGAGVGKDMVMRPWECTLYDYQAQHGMLLPMAGEAAWLWPDGRRAYFRGAVTALGLEFWP